MTHEFTQVKLNPSLIGEVVKIQIFDRDSDDEAGDTLIEGSLKAVVGTLEAYSEVSNVAGFILRADKQTIVDLREKYMEVWHYPRTGPLNHIQLDSGDIVAIASATRKGVA